MVVWLSATHTVKVQIRDEQAFRADAIEYFSNAVSPEGTDFIQLAIADAESGGWNFVQEVLLIESVIASFAGVGDSDETIYKPLLTNQKSLDN